MGAFAVFFLLVLQGFASEFLAVHEQQLGAGHAADEFHIVVFLFALFHGAFAVEFLDDGGLLVVVDGFALGGDQQVARDDVAQDVFHGRIDHIRERLGKERGCRQPEATGQTKLNENAHNPKRPRVIA